jgi:hypothetical protein
MEIDLVVTRHEALIELLLERGTIDGDVPVMDHVGISDVKGKHVLGVLPHHLSQHCASITEVPMALTLPDRVALKRGDLALKRTRAIAGIPVTYQVFGGQRFDRAKAIALAGAQSDAAAFSPMKQEALLWRGLARFSMGVELWYDKPITDLLSMLCAVAIQGAGQTVEGPVLHADLKLRHGWDGDSPLVPMTGIVRWDGDGNHGGAEVNLDTASIRFYASGPGWSRWITPKPL